MRDLFRSLRRISLLRLSARFAGFAALAALSFSVIQLSAQEQAPAAQDQAAPSAPTAPTAFPKPDPANFTATTPTKETIYAFLNANWGYDENRIWQVQAILKTPVEGISKVVIFVGDKAGKQKPQAISFFVLGDGKHLIAGDEIVPFGDAPFAESRVVAQKRADGPYRGSASKDLELVEFADFQCPHCKEAQANMEKLAVDFPKARIVFQNYPLPQHKAAAGAAAYGLCVAKLGGNDAFFLFASTVFDGQDGLNTDDGATLTLNSAVMKAGLDPAKIQACSTTPEIVSAVDASVKLSQDLNINQTPTLLINGRPVPMGGIPYETLKQIIQFQAKLDGVSK
jgi:protein-disulfide isomerase